ncbi:MAG: molybdopterin-binding protein, partial [Dokdonella sp.]
AAQLLRTGVELVVPRQIDGAHGTCHEVAGNDLCFMHVRDDRDALASVLRASATVADVVISSGGVSAGEADFLPGLIAELGRVHFWKVKMRPGMPLLCGEIGGSLMVGLPGNPVSSLATLIAIITPGFEAMQRIAKVDAKPTLHARISCDWDKKHDRTEFLRAQLEHRDDGTVWATPIGRQGSGMLGGMAESDVLLELGEDVGHFAAGTLLNALRLP